MAAIYHLADSSNGRMYVRLSVDAAGVPTVEAENTIQADLLAFNGRGKLAMFSTDGQTLWCGGDHYFPDYTKAPSLHKSVDGGATWTTEVDRLDSYGTHPGATTVMSLAGWEGDAKLVAGTQTTGRDVSLLERYNDGTDLWVASHNFAHGNGVPNSLWVREGTDEIYGTRQIGNLNRLYRSTDRGATWAGDPTYDLVAVDNSFQVVVEPDGTVTTLNFSSAVTACRGKWGGPWVNDAPIVGGSLSQQQGRMLGVDETGAVWAKLVVSTLHGVYRRDPGTGLWSLSQSLGSGGDMGGLWVVDSQNVLASKQGAIWTWNGTSWTSTTTVSLGLTEDTYSAIWGQTTASLNSVTGPDGTARVSTKGGELLTVVGKFPALTAMQAYFGPSGDTTDPECYFGFGLGYTGSSADGATVTVIAPPAARTTTAYLTLVVDGDTLVSPAIEVVERNWPEATHSMRRNIEPWKALGPRRLGEEGLE
jgi:hypothetical protein